MGRHGQAGRSQRNPRFSRAAFRAAVEREISRSFSHYSLRMLPDGQNFRPAEISVPTEMIERKIYFVRGHKVMLDSDLASLYQTPTKTLNLSVKRNATRFPTDFMFQLTKEEADFLRFQAETSKPGRGGRRNLPYA